MRASSIQDSGRKIQVFQATSFSNLVFQPLEPYCRFDTSVLLASLILP